MKMIISFGKRDVIELPMSANGLIGTKCMENYITYVVTSKTIGSHILVSLKEGKGNIESV